MTVVVAVLALAAGTALADDTPATANPVAARTLAPGTVDATTDAEDWYVLSATNAVVAGTLRLSEATSGVSVDLELWDSAATTLLSSDTVSGPGVSASVWATSLPAGDYYLRVRATAGATGYLLGVLEGPDSGDDNPASGIANALTVLPPYSVDAAADATDVRLFVHTGGDLLVELSWTATTADLDLELLGPAGAQVLDSAFSPGAGPEEVWGNNLPAGLYFLRITAFSGASGYTFATTSIPRQAPNLSASEFTITSGATSIVAGNPLPLRWRVRETEFQATGFVTERVMLSTDPTFAADADVTLFMRLDALPAAADFVRTRSITIPPGTSPGTYFIGLVLDAEDLERESSESDNVSLAVGTLTVVDPSGLTNVRATAVSAGATLVERGNTITITRGFAETNLVPTGGPIVVRLVLSADATVDAGDALLFEESVSLVAGEVVTGSLTIAVPANTPTGIYQLGLWVDANDDVLEGDETDNTLVDTVTITVTAQVQPPPPSSSGCGVLTGTAGAGAGAGWLLLIGVLLLLGTAGRRRT